ncbi:hypothetical protein jhhlp_000769 [Lomentospora prolificans]|uniref:DUF6606 domain-containing protein n=1 Tax=Lomentospora prolificans TaxID=41688 RepID=A0A2N3NJH7_9PEZI|nr:hypothetical protein jhhlp_000769 [Lomentospora prolificans]
MASCSQSSKKWMYLVNHVFLPPKLPHEDDTNDAFDRFLVDEVSAALDRFNDTQDSTQTFGAIDNVIEAISNLSTVHDFDINDGDITVSNAALERALRLLVENGTYLPNAPAKTSTGVRY